MSSLFGAIYAKDDEDVEARSLLTFSLFIGGPRRYFTIVKLSDFGAERAPAELAAVITSV